MASCREALDWLQFCGDALDWWPSCGETLGWWPSWEGTLVWQKSCDEAQEWQPCCELAHMQEPQDRKVQRAQEWRALLLDMVETLVSQAPWPPELGVLCPPPPKKKIFRGNILLDSPDSEGGTTQE